MLEGLMTTLGNLDSELIRLKANLYVAKEDAYQAIHHSGKKKYEEESDSKEETGTTSIKDFINKSCEKHGLVIKEKSEAPREPFKFDKKPDIVESFNKLGEVINEMIETEGTEEMVKVLDDAINESIKELSSQMGKNKAETESVKNDNIGESVSGEAKVLLESVNEQIAPPMNFSALQQGVVYETPVGEKLVTPTPRVPTEEDLNKAFDNSKGPKKAK